jgi:hypothetical protein
MDAPIYEEIIIKKFDLTSLEFAFLQRKLGERPAVLILPEKDKELQKKIITNILIVLKKHQINPRFPYPIYVVADVDIEAKNIPIIQRDHFAPRFFYCRNPKVTSRESNLLNKVKIIRDKLFKGDLEEKVEYIKSQAPKKREIYLLSEEEAFYQQILDIRKRIGSHT